MNRDPAETEHLPRLCYANAIRLKCSFRSCHATWWVCLVAQAMPSGSCGLVSVCGLSMVLCPGASLTCHNRPSECWLLITAGKNMKEGGEKKKRGKALSCYVSKGRRSAEDVAFFCKMVLRFTSFHLHCVWAPLWFAVVSEMRVISVPFKRNGL